MKIEILVEEAGKVKEALEEEMVVMVVIEVEIEVDVAVVV